MRGALRHPLHLLAIAAGMVGFAVAYWTAKGDTLLVGALGLAFMSAIDLARRLGLEPPDDPAAPRNRGKT
ncbi:hypothetical protein [Brevundimonas aveniformis]|uniref:hypothetical protein n=1 Tax=Brevundimonas aveniformis TaxID=370977 RepID=UPI0024928396|nr:hypothetical protein [Brevundimonas aveniformis]